MMQIWMALKFIINNLLQLCSIFEKNKQWLHCSYIETIIILAYDDNIDVDLPDKMIYI